MTPLQKVFDEIPSVSDKTRIFDVVMRAVSRKISTGVTEGEYSVLKDEIMILMNEVLGSTPKPVIFD